MLKPFGAFNLSSGSLFSAVASGGAGTGASFAAAGLLSGRPISGEPGGNAGAAGEGARRRPEQGQVLERASQPEPVWALERVLEPALQQERALARACPAAVGPELWWLEERML